MNRPSASTRAPRIALASLLMLAAGPARAATHCPAPKDAGPVLAGTDGRARLAWIEQRLSHEAHRMSWWNWGWGIGIAASGVGSLIPVPFVAPEDRVDYYTGAVLAFSGSLPFFLMPPNVLHDAPALRARLLDDPPSTDAEVCALLVDAEQKLVDSARNERLLSGWWAHAANVGINAAGLLFLGIGYHRWLSGVINGVAGLAIGEAVIFTQPKANIDDLVRYQRGDIGP